MAENPEGTSTARARLTVTPRMSDLPPLDYFPQPEPVRPPSQALPPKPALKRLISQKALHTPDQQPIVTERLQPCRVASGQPARFTCQFHSVTSTRIEWYRDNTKIEPSPDFQTNVTDTSATLLMPQAFVEDSGNFTVRISNEFGVTESTATLIVEERPLSSMGPSMLPSFTEGIRDMRIRGMTILF